MAFAQVLGRAAASNLIVGRCDLGGQVVFDDGDELIIENSRYIPHEIIVTDHTGTFNDCQKDLAELIVAYADCVEKRADVVPNTRAFAEVFVHAFEMRFHQIQAGYRKHRRGFDTLFKHKRPRGESGRGASFNSQWECTLARLDATDPTHVFGEFRRRLNLA
jgi:hypothetical protein